MLSTTPGMEEVFFRAALKRDYPQHLLNTIQSMNQVTAECALELKDKGSSKGLVTHIVTALNQLEILLQFHGDLSAAKTLREEQLDKLTNGILTEARNAIQSS